MKQEVITNSSKNPVSQAICSQIAEHPIGRKLRTLNSKGVKKALF
jgi:hypothetical protein